MKMQHQWTYQVRGKSVESAELSGCRFNLILCHNTHCPLRCALDAIEENSIHRWGQKSYNFVDAVMRLVDE